MIAMPNQVLIALATAAALFFGGYFLGKSDQRTDDAAAKAKAVEKAIVQHQAKAAAGQAVEQKTTTAVAKTRQNFLGILRGVTTHAQTQPAADDCSLDDVGLRLWRAANANTDLESASGGHDGLPAVGAARLGPDAGLAGQPRGDSAGIPPVPGASPGAGAMAEGDR